MAGARLRHGARASSSGSASSGATFQQRLIAEIARAPEAPYYECWVAALERLVLAQGLVSADELSGARERLEP